MWHFTVNQRRDADETQKTVTARSHRIVDEQKECKILEELARADLATVEPALNEATKVCIPRYTVYIIDLYIIYFKKLHYNHSIFH